MESKNHPQEGTPSTSGLRHRHNGPSGKSANGTSGGQGGEKREYTAEQHSVVRRVRACGVTKYYEILGLAKECDDSDIKKAYRKLALALHPDKNAAPAADEAFKMVSKAFQVLSDPQKRAAYDQSGSDPEDRFAGMPRSGSFATTPFQRGAGFEGELSPEDLFNMFFGGGGAFGQGMGGGQVFTATFGPGGLRMNLNGHPRQNAAGNNAQPRSIFIQLLPLLMLFGFSILSMLPGLFTSPPAPDPRFSFTPSSRYNAHMETGKYGVSYFVIPSEVNSHPTIGAELAREGLRIGRSGEEMKGERPQASDNTQGKEQVILRGKGKRRGPYLTKFEDAIERIHIQDLFTQCQHAVDRRERSKAAEIGLFGIGTDWEKVKAIENQVIESCQTLKLLTS